MPQTIYTSDGVAISGVPDDASEEDLQAIREAAERLTAGCPHRDDASDQVHTRG